MYSETTKRRIGILRCVTTNGLHSHTLQYDQGKYGQVTPINCYYILFEELTCERPEVLRVLKTIK